MTAVLTIVLKATLLMIGAIAAQGVIGGRASAAARHLVWTLTIVALLLLPVVSAVAPGWTVLRLPEMPRLAQGLTPAVGSSFDGLGTSGEAPAGSGSVASSGTAGVTAPNRVSWMTLFLVVYVLGVIAMAIRLLFDAAAMRRCARTAAPLDDAEWEPLIHECVDRLRIARPVTFLRSRERAMPMAFGIRRAAVVIPAIGDTWTTDRRRAVLLHELAHVARRDCLTELFSAIARALYWCHPGVWLIARRQRAERERACDDLVLAAGAEPQAYAGHLLEIAYALGDRRAPALAIGMARPRQLEGRLLALLDAARRRGTPGPRVRFAALAIASLVVVVLAAARATVVSGLPAQSAARENQEPRTKNPEPRTGNREPGTGKVPGQDAAPGTWEVHPSPRPGFVQVRASEGRSSWGSTVAIDRLEGVTGTKLVDGPVHFSVRRDAGTFTFEGVIRSGVGAGFFTFAPNPAFPAELAKRGVGRPSPYEQYMLARSDIGFTFLDELHAQRYASPVLAQLIKAAQNGIGLDFLRQMGALGYRLGIIDALTYQRQNGVSPEFVRDLAAQGLGNLSADDLVRARQHGIDPEYVKGFAALGYGKLSLDRLIQLRNNGVDPDFARQIADLGYRSLSLDELIGLRHNGVDPEFVREVQKAGYEHLDLNDFVSLRQSGITPGLIEMANARAKTRLPVDQLKRLAANGWK